MNKNKNTKNRERDSKPVGRSLETFLVTIAFERAREETSYDILG